jgi:electron transfer flavoprotein beta subunit
MNILVAIKQVPDKNARLVLDESKTRIAETDLSWEINESDRYAVETALRIREAAGEGEVVVCTLGPERGRKALNSALAMGCDRGIHLLDPDFQGADPLGIARALAGVARSEEFPLVLCGTRSDDAGWGETPMLLAGLLDRPGVFLAIGVEVRDGKLHVLRELEASRQESSEIPLPAVLAIQSGIYDVRYTSLKGIMAAKKKKVSQPTPNELGLSAETIGKAGRRLEILEMTPPVKTSQCEFIEGEPAAAAAALVEKLRREAKVL